MQQSSCFVLVLKDFERGGIGQVAESKNIFSKEVFLPHPRDIEFMRSLNEITEGLPFMIVIVGIPGVGKTSLLLTLLRDKLPMTIKGNYEANSLWTDIRKKHSFRKFEPSIAGHKETKHSSRLVWLVPTVDKYYSPGTRTLGRFALDIENLAKKGESIIIAGNVGVLGRARGIPKILEDAKKVLYRKNQKKLLFIRVPEEGLWIKEYGGSPANSLDKDLFRRFSFEFLNFALGHVTECYNQSRSACEERLKCERFQDVIRNLISSVEQHNGFFEGVYDLICAIRLKHHDVYFTPRTLLAYWAYALDNIWVLLNRSDMNDETVLFRGVFGSRLPSNYDYRRPAYELHETGVDMFRSDKVDQMLSEKLKDLDLVKERSDTRLNIYFKRQIKDPNMMTYNELYSLFLDDDASRAIINEAFKHFFKYRDVGFQKPDLNVDRDWAYYTFSVRGTRDRKRVYVTNREAIDNFIYTYLPLDVDSVDFERSRSRKVQLRLKSDAERHTRPYFMVDLNVFWTFLRLHQGFQVDLSAYPHVLVKIEKFLTDIEELTFPFLSKFFQEKGEDTLMMEQNKCILDGAIQ